MREEYSSWYDIKELPPRSSDAKHEWRFRYVGVPGSIWRERVCDRCGLRQIPDCRGWNWVATDMEAREVVWVGATEVEVGLALHRDHGFDPTFPSSDGKCEHP